MLLLLNTLFCLSFAEKKINENYSVVIYYYPSPSANYKDGIIIYNNDDIIFSQKLSQNIVTAKKVKFENYEKEHLIEGFFKIILVKGNTKLEFEVDDTISIYDVQKGYSLNYCAAFDIYRYFGLKYLTNILKNSSSHQ